MGSACEKNDVIHKNRKCIAFRNVARRWPSQHGHRQHAQKLVTFGRVVFELYASGQTQTNRHAHHNSWHSSGVGGEIKSAALSRVVTAVVLRYKYAIWACAFCQFYMAARRRFRNQQPLSCRLNCETIRIPGEGGRRRRRGVDGTWGRT